MTQHLLSPKVLPVGVLPKSSLAAAAFLAVVLLLPAPAARADGADKAAYGPGARLAATCTGCHGTNGNTAGDALPKLAGQSRESLLASLKAFKSGERPATVMTQLAKGYSDEQLEVIADFFAAQDAAAAAARRPGAGS